MLQYVRISHLLQSLLSSASLLGRDVNAQAEVCCRDPNGTTLAFADMMKKQIVMPAHMMDDMVHKGRTGRNIFQDFSTVAESTGTYTAQVNHHHDDFLAISACLL